MSSVEIIVLQRFKAGLVQFLDELIKWCPDDEELLATRILVKDQLPVEDVMKKFIKHLHPHEAKIEAREEKFFLDDPELFENVKDQSRVVSLKKLWKNPSFLKEDKNKVWKWFDFFLKCINLYREHHVE